MEWTMRIPRIFFLSLIFLTPAVPIAAQQAPSLALDPTQATKLAEMMCRQLPNVSTILEIRAVGNVPGAPPPGPVKDPLLIDDVHDTLVWLGPYSLPCLVDRLTDDRWMPDPRSEPLLGVPVVGDVAYMILMDKGVRDVLPDLAHKNDLRMDDYFLWPSIGDHRLRLQNAVRAWLRKHPHCCAAPPPAWRAPLSGIRFRMPASEVARARARFARLRPGMSPAQALVIVGKPDAVDSGDSSVPHPTGLLGYCAADRNETLAYIYFVERWTDEVARRDPLLDRYVIVYFSAQGKLTRMFSNVERVSPIFPSKQATWMRLMWGDAAKTR